MTLIAVSRLVAVAVSLPTLTVLVAGGGLRADNIFMVPDLAICSLLLFGAALPTRHARPVLTLGFGTAAGVITTAVFSYVSRSALDEGVPTAVVAVACAVMATLLARHTVVRLPASALVNDEEPLAGSVLVLSAEGEVIRRFERIDPAPTNIVAHGGRWYFGSLVEQPLRAIDETL